MRFTSTIKRQVEGSQKTYTVELTAIGVFIREKGTRTTYGPVNWDVIFFNGAKLQAISDMKARGK
jgi:hypothetical protein